MPAIAEAMNQLVHLYNKRATQEEEDSMYGYRPTQWICILFLSLFGISTLLHTGQAIRYRTWFMFPSVILGGIGELIGWGGRMWSNLNLLHETPFMIQISTTIISPTFILAANFIIFGRIINALGTSYSRLRPKLYAIIFLTCDLISLGIQGAGGGIASAAENGEDAKVGGNVMLGGILFQLVIITLYMVLSAEFYYRYFYYKPFTTRSTQGTIARGEFDSKTKIMSFALAFNTLVLFIRAIYRTIELIDGWDGRIITTEVYFNVLDGGMIVLAIYTFNFLHPGVFASNEPATEKETSLPNSTSQLNY